MTVRPARTSAPQADDGFSMVELMVVVFLIGLAATFIVLSAPPSKPRLESEAEAIVSLLSRAAEEAMVSGDAFGAFLDDGTVQIVRRQAGVWSPIADARVRLSQEVSLSTLDTVEGDAEGVPALWFDPVGMANPARIEIDDGRASIEIHVATNAAISIETEETNAQ